LSPKIILTSEEKVKLVMGALEEKKAVDPAVLDVRSRTVMTEFFVFATGTSQIHRRTLADAIMERLADNGVKSKRLQGYQDASWILLDYGDVVIHIFAAEQREFYRLEAYWSGSEKGSPPLLSPDEI
jgi:ribosome-associated protein